MEPVSDKKITFDPPLHHVLLFSLLILAMPIAFIAGFKTGQRSPIFHPDTSNPYDNQSGVILPTPSSRSETPTIGNTSNQYIASSELPMTSTRYNNSQPAIYVGDLNETTAWCEGVSGSGVGEYVQFIPSLQSTISTDKFVISNGFNSSSNIYSANNRVKNLDISIFSSRGNTAPDVQIPIVLKDSQGFQIINLGKTYTFDKIKLQIKSIYPGSKYDDTCISEVYTDPEIVSKIEKSLAGGDNGKGWLSYADTTYNFRTYTPPVVFTRVNDTNSTISLDPDFFSILSFSEKTWWSADPNGIKSNENIGPNSDPSYFYTSKDQVILPNLIRTTVYQHRNCSVDGKCTTGYITKNSVKFDEFGYFQYAYYHNPGVFTLDIGKNKLFVNVGFATYTTMTAVMTDEGVKPYLDVFDQIVSSIH